MPEEKKICDTCGDVRVMKESLMRIEKAILDQMGDIKLEFRDMKQDFSEFRQGIGNRVENVQGKLGKAEERLEVVMWVLKTIGGILMLSILGGLLKLIFK